MDIYIARNGKTRGPFAKNRVREMLKSGSVQVMDLAWTEKTGGWTPLYKIAGIVLQTPITDDHDQPGQTPPQVAGSESEKLRRARSRLEKAYSIILSLIGPLFLGLIVAFFTFGPIDFYKLLRTIRGVDADADRSDASTMFPKTYGNQSEEEYLSKIVAILEGVGLKNIKRLPDIPKEFQGKRSVLAEQWNDSSESMNEFYASIASTIMIDNSSLSFKGKRVVFGHVFYAERSGNPCVFAIESSGNCVDFWNAYRDEKQRFPDADCDLRWEGSHVFWMLSKPSS